MRPDRVFGWVISVALHGLLLLGAGLAVVRSSGGTAVGASSGDAFYSLSLREGPSDPWSSQFIIHDVVVPSPEASESGLLPGTQVLKESGSAGPRITNAALMEAGTRRPGLPRYGAARVDWWPDFRCGLDLIDQD